MRQALDWVYLYSTVAIRERSEKNVNTKVIEEVGVGRGGQGTAAKIPLKPAEETLPKQVDDTKLGGVTDTPEG